MAYEQRVKTEKARQGGLGRPVLIVLVAGLILAVLGWWGVEIYGERIDGGAVNAEQQQRPAG